MTGATTNDNAPFSLGVSSERKLAMPLDALIKEAQKEKAAKAKASKPAAKARKPMGAKSKVSAKNKKGTAGTPAVDTKRRQQSVKKTVSVPISKKARAKATQQASSAKRQAVVNKRRTGLVVAPADKKSGPPTVNVHLRRRQTSALLAAQKTKGTRMPKQLNKNKSGGLDVSNIERHFRTHPTKFDLPKGTNLRITINLNNVKPVVGAKK